MSLNVHDGGVLYNLQVRVVENPGFEQETAGYGEIGYCAVSNYYHKAISTLPS